MTSPHSRPFRFGFQFSGETGAGLVESAVTAEQGGFDTFLVADHVGLRQAPIPCLAAVAQATTRIRIGTFVLNATMRNPVQLAWEASTLDAISDGRFELGLGAGHSPHEYAETGIELQHPVQRKAQLGEQVEILRALLDGETVDHDGAHHELVGARVDRSVQERLPILVGGNGASLLAHAGAHADIIGLQGLGRIREDGHRHRVKWTADHLDTQIEQIRAGAGSRFDELELNALVQHVEVTDDPEAATAAFVERVEGLTLRDAASTPYALIGSAEEIAEKLRQCRERWGVSYFAVREIEAFAPVIATLRAD